MLIFSKHNVIAKSDRALPFLSASVFVRKLIGLLLLSLATTLPLTVPISAQAQINFSETTAELERLEASVNDCASRQLISSCHAALSQTHIVQISHMDSENASDRMMRNAVMLLPLYMLAELYKHKDRPNVSCGYAKSGERQLHRLLEDLETLMGQDPTAFRNIETLKRDLQDVQARFDRVLTKCD